MHNTDTEITERMASAAIVFWLLTEGNDAFKGKGPHVMSAWSEPTDPKVYKSRKLEIRLECMTCLQKTLRCDWPRDRSRIEQTMQEDAGRIFYLRDTLGSSISCVCHTGSKTRAVGPLSVLSLLSLLSFKCHSET